MNPIFLVRFDKTVDERPVDTLVAFISTEAANESALAAAVTKQAESNLAPDELIVLARESSADEVLTAMAGREMSALISRLLGRTSITLLSYNETGQQQRRVSVSDAGLKSDVQLEEILRRGATALFHRHGGFIEPNASYHFANPSGRHTDRFIRLSNILVRQAEIAFLAVAVMRFVPQRARQAYIDTPALYAVVSAINEQWRTLAPGRRLDADNFRSYAGFDKYPFSDVEESTAIISASSSGGLAGKLVDKGFAAETVVHVLFLGPRTEGLRIAVDLHLDEKCNPQGYKDDREIYEPDECQMCTRGSVPIPLRGDQFDIRGPQPTPLIIRRADAPKNLAKVMGRLAGTRAFGISSGRREYAVDAERLLSSKGFQERLDYYVRRHVPGGVRFCIIDQKHSMPFAERIKEINGSAMTIIGREEIERIDVPPTEMIEPVLVAASVIGGGRTLLEISRDLRNVCPKAPIIYLAGLGKVVSQERLDLLRRTLTQSTHHASHLLELVDEIILPAPPTPNAWTEELGLLQETRDHWPEDCKEVLQQRLDRLLNASMPLHNELFLSNDGKIPLRLQEGFAFWPKLYENHSQADVFYTVSSVLQQLRTAPVTAGEQALRTNWLQQTLLSPENFGRFNDGIIQASILRGAKAAELDFRDDASVSIDAAHIVGRVLGACDRSRGEAAVEFLIALATRRLVLRREHVQDVLSNAPKKLPLVGALTTLTKMQLKIN